MQAATVNIDFDYESWLSINTSYCHRHRCRLSYADCEKQRQKSRGEHSDLRCEGCDGLDNQSSRHLQLVALPTSAEASNPDPFAVALLSILDKTDDEEGEPEALETDYEGEELWVDEEDFDEEILRLFPELGEALDEDREPELTVKGHKKYAVYQGRCQRCSGYMDNTRENLGKWDDDVYRCLACGWRTSPAYSWNRKNPHLAGWRG